MTAPLSKDEQTYNHAASEFGVFTENGGVVSGVANYLTGMNPPFSDEEKQKGYYYPSNNEPWEGAEVRSRKNGEWGEWVKLVDNGKALIWLGDEKIITDAYQLRTATGRVFTRTLSITAGPKPE